MTVRKPDSSDQPVKRGPESVSSAGGSRRYTIEEEVGRGGMGTVYGAWDRTLKTKVAVKFPHPGVLQDREFLARFENEIRSLVRLAHPHIVSILDTGQHRGLPFVVMQYLGGGSLEDWVSTALSRAERVKRLRAWLPAIAGALDFIHGKGFIHRDVKPGNVLFDDDGHAYLGDFSIARVSYAAIEEGGSARVTQAGTVMGTPEYMAPELALAQAYNGSVDQYALAITAFEFLSGKPPYRGATPAAVLMDQNSRDVPLIHESVPWLTMDTSRVLATAMARDRWLRFATCREFADALLAALPSGGAISVEPDEKELVSERVSLSDHSFPADTQPHAAGTEPHSAKLQRPMSAVTEYAQRVVKRASALHVVSVLLSLIVLFQLAGLTVNRSSSDKNAEASQNTETNPEPIVAQVEPVQSNPHPDTEAVRESDPAARQIPAVVEVQEEDAQDEAVEERRAAGSTARDNEDTTLSKNEFSVPDLQATESTEPATTSAQTTETMVVGTKAVLPETQITNSIGMTLRLIPSGQFLMGTSVTSREFVSVFGNDVTDLQDEAPIHPVTTRQFYAGTHEVTVAQFRQFWKESDYGHSQATAGLQGTGFDPARKRLVGPVTAFQWQQTGFAQSDHDPVTNVSWNDAVAFCNWLSDREDAVYRLPTEAEWETACRSGRSELFHHGNTLSEVNRTSNVADGQTALAVSALQATWKPPAGFNDGAVFTAPVGTYEPNRHQLYDMHGNVSEWCMDWYAENYYLSSPASDPPGPASGTRRAVRGGSWLTPPAECRSASRSSRPPNTRECTIGFRVVRLVDSDTEGSGRMWSESERRNASWPPALSLAEVESSAAAKTQSSLPRPSPPHMRNRNRFQMLERKDPRDIRWNWSGPNQTYLVQFSVLDISQRQGRYVFQWKATSTMFLERSRWSYEGKARTIRFRIAAVDANGTQSDWTEWQGLSVIGSSIRRKDKRDAEVLLQRQQFQWATQHITYSDNVLW